MPIDPESGWVEPDIIINGQPLTFAECMALRVAVGNFRLQLCAVSMREGIGERLAAGSDHQLMIVERIMLARQPVTSKPQVE